jgi:proton glutamate symport protein
MSDEPCNEKSPWYASLLSPWAIIISIVAGFIIAIYFKNVVPFIAPIGKAYLALLQMCVIPIIVTAVVSSLGRLFMMGGIKVILIRLVSCFAGVLLLLSLFGLTVSSVVKPGANLDEKSRAVLGTKLAEHEIETSKVHVITDEKEESGNKQEINIWYFVQNIIPDNVFEALRLGQNLSILFFSALLGIAIGITKADYKETSLGVIETLYEAFSKMINWFMYGLPIGLCCLFADQISNIGVEILLATVNFIITAYVSIFILLIVFSIIIWKRSGVSYFESLEALKKTIIVAIGTARPIAAIPPTLSGMGDVLNFDKKTCNLVVPLGFNTISFGNVMYFSMATVFIAQMYGVDLTLQKYAIILIGSILAGSAAAGAPGIMAISMIGLVLAPLHLPIEASVVLLIAIDPLVDQLLTTVTVYGNCACTSLVVDNNNLNAAKVANA